jgi:hypothetical protein
MQGVTAEDCPLRPSYFRSTLLQHLSHYCPDYCTSLLLCLTTVSRFCTSLLCLTTVSHFWTSVLPQATDVHDYHLHDSPTSCTHCLPVYPASSCDLPGVSCLALPSGSCTPPTSCNTYLVYLVSCTPASSCTLSRTPPTSSCTSYLLVYPSSSCPPRVLLPLLPLLSCITLNVILLYL